MRLNVLLLQFELFYSEKFNGRKLKWLHHHSQGIVVLLFY